MGFKHTGDISVQMGKFRVRQETERKVSEMGDGKKWLFQ